MGWASRARRLSGAQPDRSNRSRLRPKEDLRLSERLLDLIAPFREDGLTLERYETLIGAAATAWNLSLLSEAERLEALAAAFMKAKVRDTEGTAAVVVALMRRKEEIFPDDDRVVVHWDVSESNGQWHVTVASSAG